MSNCSILDCIFLVILSCFVAYNGYILDLQNNMLKIFNGIKLPLLAEPILYVMCTLF